MPRQQPLTFAIILATASMLTACGGGGSHHNMPASTAGPAVPPSAVPQSPARPATHPPSSSLPSRPAATQGSHTTAAIPSSVPAASHTPQPVNTPPAAASGQPLPAKFIQLSDARIPRQITPSGSRTVTPLTSLEKKEIQKAFEFTNQIRAEAGVAPLVYDENLGSYAQVRSEEVATFSDGLGHHKRPNGDRFSSGLQYRNGSVGENLLGGESTAGKAVLTGWRNSPGHYANMIHSRYERVGIGFAYIPGSKYKYYWTQIFASGDARSPYNFASGTTDTGIAEDLARHIVLHNGNTITLAPGKTTATSATQGYRSNEYFSLDHPIYKSASLYKSNGYNITVYNPENSGFSYQTFAEITTPDGVPVQYANIGVPTTPDDTAQFKATYKGASIGNFRQKDHIYAEVTADIDYGGNKKTMNIAFRNSLVAPNDIQRNQPQQLTRYSNVNFDFSSQLDWDSDSHRFIGENKKSSEHIVAGFFGPHGEEIGGQFVRQLDFGTYEGVFGAKKQ